MIQIGAHPKVIQNRLGQSSVRTTLDVYGHVLPTTDDAITSGLQDTFANPRGLVAASDADTPSSADESSQVRGVDLVGRYSNQDLLSRLERVPGRQNADRPSVRTVRSTRRQVQVRLTDEQLDEVTAGYEAGLNLNELATAFGADRRTLANRLEARGVQRRHRRLSGVQIHEAITLYGEGWSLARIATRLGVYPQSVRYRLQRSGV
jgi:DNA-directed RNA polymerase specialized sigma24 family protein